MHSNAKSHKHGLPPSQGSTMCSAPSTILRARDHWSLEDWTCTVTSKQQPGKSNRRGLRETSCATQTIRQVSLRRGHLENLLDPSGQVLARKILANSCVRCVNVSKPPGSCVEFEQVHVFTGSDNVVSADDFKPCRSRRILTCFKFAGTTAAPLC